MDFKLTEPFQYFDLTDLQLAGGRPICLFHRHPHPHPLRWYDCVKPMQKMRSPVIR